jgi:hypothetical protein
MMIASRLLRRDGRSNEGVEQEFALDPRINGLFTAILRTEVRLTLAGLRWLVGGSRVVVGRAI